MTLKGFPALPPLGSGRAVESVNLRLTVKSAILAASLSVEVVILNIDTEGDEEKDDQKIEVIMCCKFLRLRNVVPFESMIRERTR